ncbi:hypothetical protein Psi02_80110 [Planotetraspora silvatica]|uniref:Uncharacterized protein n=1 Tax=Planotetraspora silvatica TaxID=234614 RepID=A0A8J3UUH4_9ACTN|nr:nucleoid-associated protein [Planotetraspora silvatica]GII51587.1 hypothetical protein Psi02_80110 [Planotetraspora silvatica]
MDISLMTYNLVARDSSHRDPQLQEIDGKVMDFLVEHVDHIQKMAESPDSAPPGTFADSEAKDIFQALHAGTADGFRASVQVLTKRLTDRMNRTTKPGLLVCLRAENDGERLAAVLKLEILEPTGATLKQLDSGELRLSAVTDMLEKPGDLQKGVLVTSKLPADTAICIDKLHRASKYFSEAMGIVLYPRPKEAMSAFYSAVEQCAPELMGAIVTALPKLEPGPPQHVIPELAKHVSGMEARLQTELISRLERAPHPVTRIDTTRSITRTINADEIIVKGPVEAMQQAVEITEKAEGGWRIVIELAGKPNVSYR